MGLKSKTGLWTLTNSIGTIEIPEIPGGIIGAVVGILTYVLAKFGFGSNSTAASGDYFLYLRTAVEFNPNNFIVDMWVDTNGWTCTDGISTKAPTLIRWWDWYANDNNRVTIQFGNTSLRVVFVVGGVVTTVNFTTGVTFDSSLHHFLLAFNQTGIIDGGGDTLRLYIDGVLVAQSAAAPANQATAAGTLHFHTVFFLGAALMGFDSTIDNLKSIRESVDVSVTIIDEVKDNRENEGFLDEIQQVLYSKKQPQVLVLNSEIDLYAEGYVLKLGKTQEKKTLNRDKITTNQMIIPLHNIDNQFCTDNTDSIFANSDWHYKPVKQIDEDGNVTWNGIIDDFIDDQNGKKTGLLTRDSLLKVFQTKIDYTSNDWETPGDAWKNICDLYGVVYNTRFVESSIAVYNSNNAFIKCYFDLVDGVTVRQALEKIAKIGAADCYSANNQLNFKLWVPFTGGVKFNISNSDLQKAVKSKLSRVYYNNYIINYVGDAGVPAKDIDNNYIGEISVDRNESHDFSFDGSLNQQIEVKDLTSAVFFGERNIKRSHIDLSTRPYPPLIINFSLPYKFKDFITLQTWFRLSSTPKGWVDKLFEVYINERDFENQILNLQCYEVDESG